MIWNKLGVSITPRPHIAWMHTWASAACLPNTIQGPTTPIYITGRQKDGASQIGIGKLHTDSMTITTIAPSSCLPLGKKGTFDEHGISYPSVVIHNNTYFLYYTGWMKGISVPWYNAVGLATSRDGIHFKKWSTSPILDRNFLDPIGIGSCCVRKEHAQWTMWYTSFAKWQQQPQTQPPKHYYHIKHAVSLDGIHWKPTGHVCIDFANTREYALARPSVVKIKTTYFMWYSYRGSTYRIGCATSKNGITWKRRDLELGLLPSKTGFDSDMVCYPYVWRQHDTLSMVYSGNGYGKSGLGIATTSIRALSAYL